MSATVTHTENKLVPELRFKEFEGEWSKLLNPIQIVAGNAYSLEDYVDEGKMLVQGINIGPGKLKLDSPYYISEQLDAKHVTLTKNDILLGLNRPITNGELKVCKYNLEEESYLYQRAGKLNFNSTVLNSEFLYQLLRSDYFLKVISIELVGSDQPYIRSNLFEIVKLWIPEFPEQKKIASFLSAVDEKIQQLTKKKELLEQYKKGVMQQLFSGKLRFKPDTSAPLSVPNPNRGLSGAEVRNGKDYPDWEEKRLGEISEITTGSSNRVDSGLDGEYTFFDRSQDIRTSSIFLFDGEAVIVAGEGQEFIPKYFIGKFDLHQRTYAIMNFEKSISKFIFFYIHYFRHYFFRQAVGTTVKSLRLPMFKKMPINLPCLEEQQKTATYLSSIDTKIESVSNQITQTQSFKKGLLQKMFV